jgi:hypothetical protein
MDDANVKLDTVGLDDISKGPRDSRCENSRIIWEGSLGVAWTQLRVTRIHGTNTRFSHHPSKINTNQRNLVEISRKLISTKAALDTSPNRFTQCS